jgi:hypothetical protein
VCPMIDPLRIASSLARTGLDRLASLPGIKLAEKVLEELPMRELLTWPLAQSPIKFTQSAPSGISPLSAGAPDRATLARLADDVYNDVPNPPAGFRVATEGDLARIGIRPEMLTSTQSAYRARVYVKGAGDDAQFVVSFRGSAAASDWKANFQQGVGLPSDHYAKALKIGQVLARNEGANVTITGHSLGGGLASAAAIASGRDAATFNAAGLSDRTIQDAQAIHDRAGVSRTAGVAAFYVKGEILSAIQDGGDHLIGALFGGPTLAAVADAPEAYGTRIALDAVRPEGKAWYQNNPINRHGMDWVLSSLR